MQHTHKTRTTLNKKKKKVVTNVNDSSISPAVYLINHNCVQQLPIPWNCGFIDKMVSAIKKKKEGKEWNKINKYIKHAKVFTVAGPVAPLPLCPD